MTAIPTPRHFRQPDLSIAIPCYNEEYILRNTATRLVQSFRDRSIDLELVLVDNGSTDDTGKIIDEMVQEGLPIVKETVTINQGYGNGVLLGLQACRGKFVGFMCADGHVDAKDVVRLYEMATNVKTPKIFKVRRRFRTESIPRRIVSVTYNILTTLLFGNLGTGDINANPKIFRREYLEQLKLQSKDWFLDPELMIKAKRMGLGVFEISVFAQMNPERDSPVTVGKCSEFIHNLVKFRFGQARKALQVQTLEPARDDPHSSLKSHDIIRPLHKDIPTLR